MTTQGYFTNRYIIIFIFFNVLFLFAGTGQDGNDARTPAVQSQNNSAVQKDILLKSSSMLATVDVAIVESRSINSGHVMDAVWASTAKNLELSSAIYNQTILDSLDLLPSSSVLIVSSGTGDLSDMHRNAILSFVRRGGNVYLQAEYKPSFTTNIAFGSLVDSMGGQFVYDSTVAGQLVPMYVGGVLQSNYNQVDSLDYFWYGCKGSGDSTIEPFLTYHGFNFGYIFTAKNSQYGKMITTSDQDWVIKRTSDALLENILKYLFDTATAISVEPKPVRLTSFSLKQNYPNPFNPVTRINYELKSKGNVLLQVFDITGRKVRTLVDQAQPAGQYSVYFDAALLSSGIYYYTLTSSGEVQSRKMAVVK